MNSLLESLKRNEQEKQQLISDNKKLGEQIMKMRQTWQTRLDQSSEEMSEEEQKEQRRLFKGRVELLEEELEEKSNELMKI